MRASGASFSPHRILAYWLGAHLAALAGSGRVGAEENSGTPGPIAIFSTVKHGGVLAPEFSEYLAGYLGNIKNYAVYNLNEQNLRRIFVLNPRKPVPAALSKAAELGAGSLLVAEVEGFRPHQGTGKVKLRLYRVQSGEQIRQWSSRISVPYFDPPWFYHIRPYGNLDEVFAFLPEKKYASLARITLLVVSDQNLDEGRLSIKKYLSSQLELSSRVLEREAGLSLIPKRFARWRPPEGQLDDIARAAAGIEGREEVDLTLVCLGPPAPAAPAAGPQQLGYARVSTNVVVTRVMNAHVFVHEIAHVLGAIHTREPGDIMQPFLAHPTLAGRFPILPPIAFGAINRRIVRTTRSLPLGANYQQHQNKVAQLVKIYEELRPEHLVGVAPYYADVLLRWGRPEEAVALLEEGLQAAPNEFQIRVRLVEALNEAGRYQEAQRLVQEEFEVFKAGVKAKTRKEVAGFAALRLSNSMLSFGAQELGHPRSRTLKIANVGTETLEIYRIGAPDRPFYLSGEAPRRTTLEPGKALEVEVVFRPGEVGPQRSGFEILSNAQGQKSTWVYLRGQGIE